MFISDASYGICRQEGFPISVEWTLSIPSHGDRVRIRAGYEAAGTVGFFVGRSVEDSGKVIIDLGYGPLTADSCDPWTVLTEAIEVFPYTREEKIEQTIEDLSGLIYPEDEPFGDDARAALYAILDAGV
jgi:hypothetical protein